MISAIATALVKQESFGEHQNETSNSNSKECPSPRGQDVASLAVENCDSNRSGEETEKSAIHSNIAMAEVDDDDDDDDNDDDNNNKPSKTTLDHQSIGDKSQKTTEKNDSPSDKVRGEVTEKQPKIKVKIPSSSKKKSKMEGREKPISLRTIVVDYIDIGETKKWSCRTKGCTWKDKSDNSSQCCDHLLYCRNDLSDEIKYSMASKYNSKKCSKWLIDHGYPPNDEANDSHKKDISVKTKKNDAKSKKSKDKKRNIEKCESPINSPGDSDDRSDMDFLSMDMIGDVRRRRSSVTKRRTLQKCNDMECEDILSVNREWLDSIVKKDYEKFASFCCEETIISDSETGHKSIDANHRKFIFNQISSDERFIFMQSPHTQKLSDEFVNVMYTCIEQIEYEDEQSTSTTKEVICTWRRKEEKWFLLSYFGNIFHF